MNQNRDSKGKFVKGNKVAAKGKICLWPSCSVKLRRKGQKFCSPSHRVLFHITFKKGVKKTEQNAI